MPYLGDVTYQGPWNFGFAVILLFQEFGNVFIERVLFFLTDGLICFDDILNRINLTTK